MAHISHHNSDTNKGVITLDCDRSISIQWAGDFEELENMSDRISKIEKAAFLAGIGTAFSALDDARKSIEE